MARRGLERFLGQLFNGREDGGESTAIVSLFEKKPGRESPLRVTTRECPMEDARRVARELAQFGKFAVVIAGDTREPVCHFGQPSLLPSDARRDLLRREQLRNQQRIRGRRNK